MALLSSIAVRVRLLVAGRFQFLREDAGLSTAELLGNAALGIAVLVAVWGALKILGLDIVKWIGDQLFNFK